MEMTSKNRSRQVQATESATPCAELARAIAARTPQAGRNSTIVPGMMLFRQPTPSICHLASVEPGVTIFVQGRKRIAIGGADYLCQAGSFLVASVDLPVQSQIVEATPDTPQLSMRLLFDMKTVREVVSREDLPTVPRFSAESTGRRGLAVGHASPEMMSVGLRLVHLLDRAEEISFFRPLLERELIYRILQTPQGERLRAIATAGNISQRTARVIAWLSAHYARPLRMESLAEIAQMGVSTLHHQFRALTGMSPLQFQKQLRLKTARERMLNDGLDATSAAFEVGYESVSQFNREYSRFFGQPPMRDVRLLREGMQRVIDAA